MPVKLTIGLATTQTGDRRYTIGGSFWLAGSNALDGSADDACFKLTNARLGVCAGNVQLISIRQSLFTLRADGKPIAARARNRIITPGVQVGTGRVIASTALSSAGAFTQYNSDQPKASVLCFMDGQIQPAGVQSTSNLYMAGIPDDIIMTGANVTPNTNAVPGWYNAFLTFVTQLNIGNFSFLGTLYPPTSTVLPIIRWANESAGAFRLMFTIGSNAFGVGQIVHLRGQRMSLPRVPTPQGKWKIDAMAGPDASGNYTYTLKNSQGFSAGSIVTDGTVESVGFAFYKYLGTGTPQRATTRKRGASYGAARGRSKARPRLLV